MVGQAARPRHGPARQRRRGPGRARAPGHNAFPPLRRALRRWIVPVYDYVLVTEPLTAEQLAAVGWRNRQGISDTGNLFHYYRLTDDDRILMTGPSVIVAEGYWLAER